MYPCAARIFSYAPAPGRETKDSGVLMLPLLGGSSVRPEGGLAHPKSTDICPRTEMLTEQRRVPERKGSKVTFGQLQHFVLAWSCNFNGLSYKEHKHFNTPFFPHVGLFHNPHGGSNDSKNPWALYNSFDSPGGSRVTWLPLVSLAEPHEDFRNESIGASVPEPGKGAGKAYECSLHPSVWNPQRPIATLSVKGDAAPFLPSVSFKISHFPVFPKSAVFLYIRSVPWYFVPLKIQECAQTPKPGNTTQIFDVFLRFLFRCLYLSPQHVLVN